VGRIDFDAGKSISRPFGKGWALKIKTFLGPEMAANEARAIWAQKIFINYSINSEMNLGLRIWL
jgi:hypothetical protein